MNELSLGLSQQAVKLNLGPVHLIGLGVCLLGIGSQFFGAEASAREAIDESRAGSGASGKIDDGGEWVVTKSRKQREKTKRRAYFPFRDLKSLGEIVGSPMSLSEMDEFILENGERRGVLAERKRLKEVERNWRNMGLGPKHPDVLTATVMIDRLEASIWEQWEDDHRSHDERK